MRIWGVTSGICLAFSLSAIFAAGLTDQEKAFIRGRGSFWAFQKPSAAPVPNESSPFVHTAVDAFLLEALRAKQVEPSVAASRLVLLRRAYLDVTGLPPTPEEAARFLKDRSADAWEKLIDRLMASPRYGERMAMKWLDIVRYADTNGFELDAERPDAWRYRDYVVASFNADKPYDRFLEEQFAGDEMFPGDRQALVALGFLRAGPRHVVGGNIDPEMSRQEDLVEMTASVGSTFLGLTVGCARCHNHKFDPILQSDYYRLQAIFAATEFKETDLAAKQELASHAAAMKAYEARLKPVTDQIAALEKPYRERLREAKRQRLDAVHTAALEVPKDKRTREQETLAKEAESQVGLTWDEVVHALTPEDRERRAALRRQLHALERGKPPAPAKAFSVENMTQDPPPTYVLKVGDYHHKLGRVEPGFLKVISTREAPVGAAGRRSALARWLTSREHPLTARVMVNRIWQMRMGTGLVATPNDFGLLGARPSNRKLLDWLAVEFMEHGWSVKHIDRLILTSSAYRQQTANDPAKAAKDPENRLYWRMNRRRLDAETLRDEVLAVSGKLNPAIGGPPVRVPLEPEVYDLIFTEGEPDNLWPLSEDETQQYRRSLYLMNKRGVRLPMLANFDQPDAMTSCPVRPVSTHALQALSLMNSNFMQQQSQALAARLTAECKGSRNCEVKRAYRLALARPANPVELKLERRFRKTNPALSDFCLALLNRNEFVYIP